MLYISNSFSIQMLPETGATVQVVPVTPEQVAADVMKQGFESAVGHQDTAAVISTILGISIPMNRINIQLNKGDVLYVARSWEVDFRRGRQPSGRRRNEVFQGGIDINKMKAVPQKSCGGCLFFTC